MSANRLARVSSQGWRVPACLAFNAIRSLRNFTSAWVFSKVSSLGVDLRKDVALGDAGLDGLRFDKVAVQARQVRPYREGICRRQ